MSTALLFRIIREKALSEDAEQARKDLERLALIRQKRCAFIMIFIAQRLHYAGRIVLSLQAPLIGSMFSGFFCNYLNPEQKSFEHAKTPIT